MSKPQQTLDQVRERVERISDFETNHAERDRAILLGAVDAVLALHSPFTHHFLTPPAGSLETCFACHEAYPCPTVQAITAATQGEA